MDYTTLLVTRKSHSVYTITFMGNPGLWTTKNKSTTEAKFIAMNKCSEELQGFFSLLTSPKITLKTPKLNNDNSGALVISKEAQLNSKLNHIKLRFQYLRDLVKKKILVVKQVGTKDMAAYVLRKSLATTKHGQEVEMLRLVNYDQITER
ncbi:hypothetical protein O181_113391 [Austropuccinia psidii MF-1]|uniref:Uncharacterized protein n=1 Tax=Austropuccinia psidii MF-1 TaxID=1389203 RepID=A0A9Q3K489_9BASI|nr:hypothetical protein [Austropuccinia psidii MF-1]